MKRGLTASALAWGWVPGESELSRGGHAPCQ